MIPASKKLLFVYGTLKKGHKNAFMLYNSTFVGRAVIFGYAMYKLKEGYPGIISDKRGSIDGELYWVDQDTLRKLDDFEGVPTLYRRDTQIMTLSDGTIATAHFYVYQRAVYENNRIETNPCEWTKDMEK